MSTPDLNRLPRTTLIETLVARMEEEILSGRLALDARLPSEGALSNTFGVSRPVVREALARLRERGLVETVNGSGTFVRRPDAEHLTDAFLRHIRGAGETADEIAALYEARTAIELTAVRLATLRATDEQLAAIGGHIDAMQRARNDEDLWSQADLAFHTAIADATGNRYFPTLLTPLATAIVTGMHVSYQARASRQAGLRAHREILDRMSAQDADGAVEAMRAHLEDSRARYAAAVLPTGEDAGA
jgi:GntR family transcriptional repressor for pyruvate dehydrogenase complex